MIIAMLFVIVTSSSGPRNWGSCDGQIRVTLRSRVLCGSTQFMPIINFMWERWQQKDTERTRSVCLCTFCCPLLQACCLEVQCCALWIFMYLLLYSVLMQAQLLVVLLPKQKPVSCFVVWTLEVPAFGIPSVLVTFSPNKQLKPLLRSTNTLPFV